MKLFITYELSPFTAGGTGTYLSHVLKINSEKRIDCAVLFGLPKSQVDQFRAELSERVFTGGPPPELFSAFDLASERNGSNVYWNRSALFCEAILKIVVMRDIEYIEFFDYCGPAYHLLMEKCSNPMLKNIEISIRFHNTIELIDRASGRLQLPGTACPYGLERRAIALADSVIIPGQKSWDENAAKLYGVSLSRLRISSPPFASDSLPKLHQKRTGIAFLGRPSIIKGFDTFLSALNILAVDTTIDDLPAVTIIGPVETITGALDIESELKKNPLLRTKISSLGHVHPAELKHILGGYDIVVFPNRTESYCYALHEARLAGCRIIINKIPAFVEHIPLSARARVFDGTPRDLAKQLAFFLTTPDSFLAAENQALREHYIQLSYNMPDEKNSFDAAKKKWDEASICSISQRDDANAITVDAFKAAWSHSFPFDEIVHAQQLKIGNIPSPSIIYSVSIFGGGVSADQFARARRLLDLNTAIGCVLIFPNVLEQSLVENDTAFVSRSGHLSVNPAVVIWRFENLGTAADHIAKGIDRLDNAITLMQLTNVIAIGVSDHPMAIRSKVQSGQLTHFKGAFVEDVTLLEAEARIQEMSCADADSDYIFLIRGQIRLATESWWKFGGQCLEGLFGFFNVGQGVLEGWFGGIRIRRSGVEINMQVMSESAEVWAYRNGLKVVHMLRQGQITMNDAYDENKLYRLRAANLNRDDTGPRVVENYENQEITFYLGITPQSGSLKQTFVYKTVDAACEHLAFMAGQSLQIVVDAEIIREGTIEQLTLAGRFIANINIILNLPYDLLSSHKWLVHNGIFDALKFVANNPRICLKLIAPTSLANSLLKLGIPCEIDQTLFPRLKPATRHSIGAQMPTSISILISSTGTFSGVYGHLLSALALVQKEHPKLTFNAEITSPNHESEKLIHDLGLKNRISVSGDNPKRQHDLVLEVYPDGQISAQAAASLNSGAAAVLASASRKWVNDAVPAKFVTDWEASDEIASVVVAAIEQFFKTESESKAVSANV